MMDGLTGEIVKTDAVVSNNEIGTKLSNKTHYQEVAHDIHHYDVNYVDNWLCIVHKTVSFSTS
jgi:hypothetical protein